MPSLTSPACPGWLLACMLHGGSADVTHTVSKPMMCAVLSKPPSSARLAGYAIDRVLLRLLNNL